MDDELKNKKVLLDMNGKYAVVLDGGKVRVLYFEKRTQVFGQYKVVREIPMFLDFADFRNLHCNKFVSLKGKKEGESSTMPLGAWWLRHSHRSGG